MSIVLPFNIHPYDTICSGGRVAHHGNQTALTGTTSQTLTANQLVFWPFFLPENFVIKKAFVYNGAAVSGDIDVGVYTPGGTRICSVGSTAQAGTNQIQTMTLDAKLGAGQYFLAFGSNTATTVFGTTASGTAGQTNTSGSYGISSAWSSGLPASVTFAGGNTVGFYVVGISRRSVI